MNKQLLLQAVFGERIGFEPKDKVIKELLSSLEPNERFVLERRFADGPMTLEEIGNIYLRRDGGIGVLRERIRQVEGKALRKLRHPTRAMKLLINYDYHSNAGKRAALAVIRAYNQGYFKAPVTHLNDEQLLTIPNFGVKSLELLRKAIPGPGKKDRELIVDKEKCPVCGSDVDLFAYGLFNSLTQFAEKHGWEIVAASYNRPELAPCTEGEHDWDGRRLAGITFRRCNKCGIIQRRCYEPYFVDHQVNISEEEWFSQEKGSITDLVPGTVHAWL